MFLIELESSEFLNLSLSTIVQNGVCISYHPVSSWIILSSRPVQVNPNLSAMPRPCKRKLRPLSDDDSDGPDTCDAAQAASPAGRHAPGIGTTRSTSGSPSSSESSQVPQKSGEDVEAAAEEAEQTSPGKFEEMDEMGSQLMADQQAARKPARHRARRAVAKAPSGESQRQPIQPIPTEEIIEPEAFELNLAYPKPRSKFVSLLWEFASPPTPMLSVDVDWVAGMCLVGLSRDLALIGLHDFGLTCWHDKTPSSAQHVVSMC